MSRALVTLATLALALALGACSSVTGTGDPSMAATVNGERIEISELETQYALVSSGADLDADQTGEETANALQYLVRLELLAQGAADLGVELTDDDIVEAREGFAAQFGGMEALEQQLELEGMELSDLDTQFRSRALELQVGQVLQERVDIADEDVRDAYDQQYGDRPTVRHILVETEEEAEDVLGELEDGADFNELAVERSTDPTAQDNEGELGELEPGQTVPEFDAAVFGAEAGEVVGPVQTQFGFHVLEVTDVRPVEDPPDFGEVEEDIRARLENEAGGQAAFLEWIQGVADDAEVEVNPRFGRWNPDAIAVVPDDALDRDG